jgi:hypothetical protein
MEYREPSPVERKLAERLLYSDDPDRIRETLVALAFYEPDWQWVQEECLRLTNHENWSIRAVAATCLGHLARVHRRLDLNRVLPRLEELKAEASTAGYAADAMSDIEMYIVSERDQS